MNLKTTNKQNFTSKKETIDYSKKTENSDK